MRDLQDGGRIVDPRLNLVLGAFARNPKAIFSKTVLCGYNA